MSGRRWKLFAGVALTVVCIAAALPAEAKYRGTDIFQNTALAPGDSAGGFADKYPLSAYNLDTHIDTGTLGVSAVPETVVSAGSSVIWSITTLLCKGVIQLFTFAFGLKLLTGPAGALAPVGQAVQDLYGNVFGQTFLVIGILVGGIWAIWKAFVQQRTGDAMAGLGLSVLLMVTALFFVLRPEQTVGTVSGWADDLSIAVLAGGTGGDTHSARQRVTDELFITAVVTPWTVLEFGGLQTCVDPTHKDKDGVPKPVGPHDHNAHCRSNAVFAARYVVQPSGSDERTAEYDAINQGRTPVGDPQFPPSYHLSDSDRPAVDMQQQGAAFQRFTMTVVLFFGLLGLVALIGMLALLVVVVQLVALVILGFAPLMPIAAAIPSRGHGLVLAWLQKLFSTLAIKVIYSLVLVVVLVVGRALSGATGTLGFSWAFVLQGLYYWSVFFYRRKIVDRLLAGVGGVGTDGSGRDAMRATRRPLRTLADISMIKDAARRRPHGDRDEGEDKRQESGLSGGDPGTTQTQTVTSSNGSSNGVPHAHPDAHAHPAPDEQPVSPVTNGDPLVGYSQARPAPAQTPDAPTTKVQPSTAPTVSPPASAATPTASTAATPTPPAQAAAASTKPVVHPKTPPPVPAPASPPPSALDDADEDKRFERAREPENLNEQARRMGLPHDERDR